MAVPPLVVLAGEGVEVCAFFGEGRVRPARRGGPVRCEVLGEALLGAGDPEYVGAAAALSGGAAAQADWPVGSWDDAGVNEYLPL